MACAASYLRPVCFMVYIPTHDTHSAPVAANKEYVAPAIAAVHFIFWPYQAPHDASFQIALWAFKPRMPANGRDAAPFVLAVHADNRPFQVRAVFFQGYDVIAHLRPS